MNTYHHSSSGVGISIGGVSGTVGVMLLGGTTVGGSSDGIAAMTDGRVSIGTPSVGARLQEASAVIPNRIAAASAWRGTGLYSAF
jgi:alanine dehydrogenase